MARKLFITTVAGMAPMPLSPCCRMKILSSLLSATGTIPIFTVLPGGAMIFLEIICRVVPAMTMMRTEQLHKKSESILTEIILLKDQHKDPPRDLINQLQEPDREGTR